MHILVLGGGPAGLFAALSAQEAAPEAEIVVCEAAEQLAPSLIRLKRGGGIVTRQTENPREFVDGYTRGVAEILGPLARWSTLDTIQWFRTRGLKLKVLKDETVIAGTGDSKYLGEWLIREAESRGITLWPNRFANECARSEGGPFRVWFREGNPMEADRLILATGSTGGSGFAIASAFGHEVVNTYPALFEFKVKDKRLRNLNGLSFPHAHIKARVNPGDDQPTLEAEMSGEVTISGKGIGGQAVADLSNRIAQAAWSARYAFDVTVNWSAERPAGRLHRDLRDRQVGFSKRVVAEDALFGLNPKFWKRAVEGARIGPEDTWGSASNRQLQALLGQLTAARFRTSGYSLHKPESIFAGGIALNEIDFRTMESRFARGLHFAGEMVDVDGLTGGFNMQAAWTTARLAGVHAADGLNGE